MKVTVAMVVCAVVALSCARSAPAAKDVDGLARKLAEAGLECAEVERGEPGKLVAQRASCILAAGESLELFVFASADQRDDWAVLGAQLRPTALGPNWAISGKRTDIGKIVDALNAELVLPEDGR